MSGVTGISQKERQRDGADCCGQGSSWIARCKAACSILSVPNVSFKEYVWKWAQNLFPMSVISVAEIVISNVQILCCWLFKEKCLVVLVVSVSYILTDKCDESKNGDTLDHFLDISLKHPLSWQNAELCF